MVSSLGMVSLSTVAQSSLDTDVRNSLAMVALSSLGTVSLSTDARNHLDTVSLSTAAKSNPATETIPMGVATRTSTESEGSSMVGVRATARRGTEGGTR